MNNKALREIKKEITIAAPVSAVWKVFTDPQITARLGGTYVTSWIKNSPFEWRDRNNKTIARGVIMDIGTEVLLQLRYTSLREPEKILTTITYNFNDASGGTRLVVSDVMHYEVSEEEYKNALAGWDQALAAIAQAAKSV